MSYDELKNKNIEELVKLARERQEAFLKARANPKEWNTLDSIRNEIVLIYECIDERIMRVFIRGGVDA